jgi:S1-C subfamily serine protease
MKWFLLLIFSLLISSFGEAHESSSLVSEVRSSVFKIYASSQTTLHSRPWTFESIANSSGSGFLIGPNLILTNAHVVAHAKSLFVQKDRDPEMRRAYVKFVAHDVDLALISLVDESGLKGIKPLSFADNARLGDSVLTIGFPIGGEEISVTKGIISRFDYRLYAHSAFSKRLLFQVDSAINHGNSGGPVFIDNKVLGVAFQSKMTDQNIGYVIPFLVVKRFLLDVQDGTYDKQPATGIHVRAWVTRNEEEKKLSGVEVTFVEKDSITDGVLMVGDRLLEVDGKPVGIDGKVIILGERISFKALFGLAQIGSSIKFKVLRNAKEETLTAKVRAYQPHFSSLSFERNPRFVSYGGLVFTPLSTNWLREKGPKWMEKTSPFLNYLYNFSEFDPFFDEVSEFVILSSVLVKNFVPQSIFFLDGVVESFNGQKVKSLDHFHKLFEEEKKETSKIKFYNKRELLFVKTDFLKKGNNTVKNLFSLKQDKMLESPIDGAVRKEDLLK